MSVFAAILLAVSAFVATNVDDVFILVGFMSDPAYRLRDVILGQFLGAAAMTLLCLALASAAIGVSPALFGWLGLIEIGIGVKKLFERHRMTPAPASGAPRQRNDGFQTVTLATIGGFGDNVGVYVPLFAGSGGNAGLVCTVFGAMTGLWCLGAYWLTGRSTLGAKLRDLAARLLPWMMIAIGIVILSHAGSLAVLMPATAGTADRPSSLP